MIVRVPEKEAIEWFSPPCEYSVVVLSMVEIIRWFVLRHARTAAAGAKTSVKSVQIVSGSQKVPGAFPGMVKKVPYKSLFINSLHHYGIWEHLQFEGGEGGIPTHSGMVCAMKILPIHLDHEMRSIPIEASGA